MLLKHIPGLLFNPSREWPTIRSRADDATTFSTLMDLLILAAIPGVCSFVGSVYFGWSITGHDPVRVTMMSALVMALASWVAIAAGVVLMGLFVHWMEITYGSRRSYSDCICFAIYVSVPLCLTGLSGLYPSIPLSTLAVLLGIAWSARLLYLGIPLFMRIPNERGFLFSSSIVCVALVMLVSMKVVTVFFWDLGFGPEFNPD